MVAWTSVFNRQRGVMSTQRQKRECERERELYVSTLRPLRVFMQLIGMLAIWATIGRGIGCCSAAVDGVTEHASDRAAASLPLRERMRRSAVLHCCRWRRWLLTVHMLFVLALLACVAYAHYVRQRQVKYSEQDITSQLLDIWAYSASLLVVHCLVVLETNWKAVRCNAIFERLAQMSLLLDVLSVEQGCAVANGRVLGRACRGAYAVLGAYVLAHGLLMLLTQLMCDSSEAMLFNVYSEVLLKLKLCEFMLLVACARALLCLMCDAGVATLEQLHRTRYELACSEARRAVIERLVALQELHALLWEVLRDIEDYFAWSLVALLLKMFIDITTLGYWCYINYIHGEPAIFTLYCAGVSAAQLLLLFAMFSYGTDFELKALRFRALFFGVNTDRKNRILSAALRRLIYQLQHECMQISAGGFAVINRGTFGAYAFMAVAYIVILIQFHMSV